MKKRIVSFLMALVMAVSLLPVSAFAVEDGVSSDVPAAVAQEVQTVEAQKTEDADASDVQVYATNPPSAYYEYAPTADDIKVIGTYQVDENTTWDVRLITVDSTQYNYIKTALSVTGMVTDKSLTAGDSLALREIITHHYKGSAEYDAGVQLYTQIKDNMKLTEELDVDATQTCFYNFKYNKQGRKYYVTDAYGLLIVQWTAGEVVIPDKTALQAAIDAAPKAGDGTYYTANDRYDGKTVSVSGGFWAEYMRALDAARRANVSSVVKQDEIDAAVANLQAAIAKLIPTSLANTTLLYEELQTNNDDGAYTTKSWAAYKPVRDKAEALMATMFDAEGNPTDDNKAAAQESIETMAAELETARKALDEKGGTAGKTIAKLEIEAIRYLAKQYEPDALTGYTAESIEALRQARATAVKLADETPLDDLGQNQRYPLTAALRELRKAIYGLTTTDAAQIKVDVSVLDTNDIHHGYTGELAYLHNPNTYTASLTLDANASAYDLLNGKSLLKNRNIAAEAVLFLNGELVYGDLGSTSGYDDLGYTAGSGYSTFQAIRLHDKDELTIVWIYPKQVEYSSQTGTYPAYLMDIPDYFRYSTISAPIEVEAGQPFTVSVTSETALPFHCAAGTRAVTGAAVYRSDAAESAEAAATGYVGVNTYAVTDESGKATLTLYNEGYVLLNAFRTDIDEARYTVGASVLVHVTAAGDLDAVKQQLREKLDAVYNDE